LPLKKIMTKLARPAIFALMIGVAVTAAAQSVPKAATSAEDHFAPVTWLIGGTWTSDVKDPDSGTVTHVQNQVRWAPNHQAIEFVTEFGGKPHYNGFYAYDAASKSVRFYYTSSEGELTTGTAALDVDGKTLHQDFDIVHSNGSVGHLRSTIVRDGPDAYGFSVFMSKNGEWAKVFEIRYRRK
jgi:hypothetical protein